ncbi:MAG: outer membrane lipoprotein-sorting protein [Pseudomonadota bacterium]
MMKCLVSLPVIFMTAMVFLLANNSLADDPKAREIMKKVEDRDDGDQMTSSMLMVLMDKNGDRREKYFKNFSKDYGKDKKRIMFIEKPENIRNTGFLTFDYDDADRDDDQWLFLPALGKTKRIASSDKSGSFMGSDLNYSDMTDRELGDYDFKLLQEMEMNGAKVWLIESVPRKQEVIDETGYKKAILAIRQDNYVMIRSKSWTSEGGYIKIMDVQELKPIEGIWVSTKIHVVKRQGDRIRHQTLLTISDVKFNQNPDDDLFTIRRLEKGL